MSQENVEVVRQALQAFADGGVDAMAEFWDPDIVYRAAEGAIDDVGEMHGPVAVRRYIQDWIDTFDDSSVVVEELRDVGNDRVLAIQRVKGRAKLSGVEIDVRYAAVSTVRDGKIVRGREYLSVEEALEAVGLSEQAMSNENVAVVRRMTEVWNERGWQGVVDDGLLHPDIEYHDDPAWPEARSAYGTQPLVERFDEVLEAIGQRGHTTVEQTVAHGAHVVLVLRLTGEGTASRIPYEYRWGFLCRISDGQIDYIQAYLDPSQALQAVGWSD